MESDNKQRVPDIDLRFVSVTLFITTDSILCLKLTGCYLYLDNSDQWSNWLGNFRHKIILQTYIDFRLIT